MEEHGCFCVCCQVEEYKELIVEVEVELSASTILQSRLKHYL